MKKGKVVGKVTDCVTKNESMKEYGWILIERNDGGKEIRVEGGPTGFENFVVHQDVFRKLLVNGWCACMGVKEKHDRLIFPAYEMKKIYQEVFGQ